MSQENVEVVRRTLEALEQRDLTTWLPLHDEDFEVVPIRDWPETGVRGRDAAWNFYLEALDAFERFPAIDTELVDAGADKALLHYRLDLSGRGSGAGIEFEAWVVITVRQGRLLRRVPTDCRCGTAFRRFGSLVGHDQPRGRSHESPRPRPD